MSRRCGSSKLTLTPLNGLAMEPGKREDEQLKGTQTLESGKLPIENLPRTADVTGGGETERHHGKTNHRRRHYGKENRRRTPPAHRQCGGGGETKIS